MGCGVVTGQGVVRVRAGDERGCIVGESGLAPVGRAAQGRELGDLAGEMGEDGALRPGPRRAGAASTLVACCP